MENDPQTAWKIINEVKNDSLPADKAEKKIIAHSDLRDFEINYGDLLIVTGKKKKKKKRRRRRRT